MKKAWLLINLGIAFTTCCKYYTIEHRGFVSQLLQPGDVIEGYYTLHPYAQQAVTEWLKKFTPHALEPLIRYKEKLSDLVTPQQAVLDGEEIVVRISQKTFDSMILKDRRNRINNIIRLPGLNDFALAFPLTFMMALVTDKETSFLIAALYHTTMFFKRRDNFKKTPADISKIINLNDGTVAIKFTGLRNELEKVKRNLPSGQSIWIESESGIPRILRDQSHMHLFVR